MASKIKTLLIVASLSLTPLSSWPCSPQKTPEYSNLEYSKTAFFTKTLDIVFCLHLK